MPRPQNDSGKQGQQKFQGHYGNGMLVWEAYGKGVPLLRVSGEIPNKVGTPWRLEFLCQPGNVHIQKNPLNTVGRGRKFSSESSRGFGPEMD